MTITHKVNHSVNLEVFRDVLRRGQVDELRGQERLLGTEGHSELPCVGFDVARVHRGAIMLRELHGLVPEPTHPVHEDALVRAGAQACVVVHCVVHGDERVGGERGDLWLEPVGLRAEGVREFSWVLDLNVGERKRTTGTSPLASATMY